MKNTSTIFSYILMLLLLGTINNYSQTVSTIANLNAPDGIVYKDGVLYASKFTGAPNLGNVYKIYLTGNVNTYIENQEGAADLKFDSNGNLHFATFNNSSVKKVLDSNQTTVFASGLSGPVGLVFDPADNLFVMNDLTPRITKITPNGIKSTYAEISGFGYGSGITIDPEGNIYACSYSHGNIYKINNQQEVELFSSTGAQGLGFVLYSNGKFFATSLKDHKIYKISLSGESSTYAGTGQNGNDDGDVSTATFNRPNGITASPNGDTLFIAESNKIRMIVSNSTTSIGNENFTQPTKHKLKQNYPNPFNPSTNISYTISEPSFVSLKIYDSLGNEIRSLINENQTSKNYSIKFNAQNLASGTYFVSLKVGDNFRSAKKMIYLK